MKKIVRIRSQVISLLWCSIVLSLAHCGRYGAPIPPEERAPRKVESVIVTPQDSSLTFTWGAPAHDRSGKELASIEGYRIERKTISKQSDIMDPSIPFIERGFIQDAHIIERERLRKEAREKGLPGRRIDVEPRAKQFTFIEKDLGVGSVYLYKITPLNQDGVEGDVASHYLISWQGSSSKITTIIRESDDDTFTGEEA